MNKTKLTSSVLIVALSFSAVGCQSDSGTGTAIGAGAGAGAGALIGSAVSGHGNRTEGALVGAGAGALIGGLSGYAIGREGDKKKEAAKRERDREDRYYQTPAQPTYTPPAQQTPAYTPPAAAAQALTKADVKLWASQGVREDIIIDRIQRSGTRFNLSAADENELRDARVSEAVIREMKATANR